MEYVIKKANFNKKKIRGAYVFFENGEYVSLDGSELVDISVNVYDNLVWHYEGFCAVAQSGFIKLNIQDRNEFNDGAGFLYNQQEYNNNRKKYIEQRCFKERCITEIWFFDELNRHKELLGNFSVASDGEYIKLVVLPQPQMGESSGEKHKILLGDINKEKICCITLDFENGESFMVFNSEIEDINLVLDKKLELGSSRYQRRVKEGYIKLKLPKNLLPRGYDLFDDKDLKRKNIERRLCGKNGSSTHDICRLNIAYDHAGASGTISEDIEVYDMEPKKEVDKLVKQEENEYAPCYRFVSGYAKLLKDRTIILTFGNNAKRLMKELRKRKN